MELLSVAFGICKEIKNIMGEVQHNRKELCRLDERVGHLAEAIRILEETNQNSQHLPCEVPVLESLINTLQNIAVF